MTKDEKVIPYSNESETIVLGKMLAGHIHLIEKLEETDFHLPENKAVFQVINTAYKNNKNIDTHLVSEELKRQDQLKSIGGPNYLANMERCGYASSRIEECIEELKAFTAQRRIIKLGLDIIDRATKHEEPTQLIQKTQEELKRIERGQGAKERFPIQFLNKFDQHFLLADPPIKPMLLEYANERGSPTGFLPKGIVAMLVGAGGVGKTHLLAQLAIAIASGTPFLDTYTTTAHCGIGKRGPVFFGLGENTNEDIHRVLYKAAKKLRIGLPDTTKENLIEEAGKRIAPFSFCGQQAAFIENKKPSLYFRQFKARLIDAAPDEGWSLLILDPISRLLGADAETDNAAATQFIALLEELIADLPGHPTILCAHHVSKAALQQGGNQNQSAARGSSALTDGVRWQCNFAKTDSKNEPAEAILKMTKSNFTKIPEEIKTKKDLDGFIERYSTHPADQIKKLNVSFE